MLISKNPVFLFLDGFLIIYSEPIHWSSYLLDGQLCHELWQFIQRPTGRRRRRRWVWSTWWRSIIDQVWRRCRWSMGGTDRIFINGGRWRSGIVSIIIINIFMMITSFHCNPTMIIISLLCTLVMIKHHHWTWSSSTPKNILDMISFSHGRTEDEEEEEKEIQIRGWGRRKVQAVVILGKKNSLTSYINPKSLRGTDGEGKHTLFTCDDKLYRNGTWYWIRCSSMTPQNMEFLWFFS